MPNILLKKDEEYAAKIERAVIDAIINVSRSSASGEVHFRNGEILDSMLSVFAGILAMHTGDEVNMKRTMDRFRNSLEKRTRLLMKGMKVDDVPFNVVTESNIH